MRKYILILMLTFFAFAASAQKMTMRTCQIQYGDVINYNLNDLLMDGEPCPYVAKFQLTKDNFIEIVKGEKYKYTYASTSHIGLKATEDFRITIQDKLLNDYDVLYSYKEQTLTFLYTDGENHRVTIFTIDNVKVK